MNTGLMIGLAVLVVALLLAREAWLHLFVAGVAHAILARGHHARAQKLYERIVRQPSLFGTACAPNERYRLAWCYLSTGRPQDAVSECRAILAARRAPSVEATVRRRLADALEAAGELDAAAAERKRAEQCLERGERDLDYYLVRGRELSGQRQYVQACESYRTAVELIPKGNDVARAETMVRLSLACFHAGFHAEAVTWAEQALALDPPFHVRVTAHSAAAIGYSSQELLEESEQHHRQAYETAVAAGAKEKGAGHLASLGGIQRRRGKLAEAVQSCEEATALSRGAWRLAGLCEAEALRSLGRFDQARAALARAQRAESMAVPAEERRSQATLALAFAHLEAEAGQPESAERWLAEARPGLVGDARLLLWVDALAAWVAALLGRATESTTALTDVQRRQAQYPGDRTIWEICTSVRARICSTNGDHAAACAAWSEYLSGTIDPIDRPTALYELGECRTHLGDLDGARDAYRQAVETGIESHDARLARRRLAVSEGAPVPNGPCGPATRP